MGILINGHNGISRFSVDETIAETDNKYIVSKGPRHEEYDLPPNAWGDRFLPQVELVPLMDLIITNGGNNTTTRKHSHRVSR